MGIKYHRIEIGDQKVTDPVEKAFKECNNRGLFKVLTEKPVKFGVDKVYWLNQNTKITLRADISQSTVLPLNEHMGVSFNGSNFTNYVTNGMVLFSGTMDQKLKVMHVFDTLGIKL